MVDAPGFNIKLDYYCKFATKPREIKQFLAINQNILYAIQHIYSL